MKKIVKEPLLHFLLLGAALFVAHHFVAGPGKEKPGQILVTQGEIASMITGFSRTWQRPPTHEELEGLIRDRVREEVYYREALAMGLDRDDSIIRRRLRQKLEFVSNDVAALAEPTDSDLAEYFKAHVDNFRVQRQITFSQVFLNPEKHGESLTQDAEQLLVQLRQQGRDADVSSVGDSSLLEHRLESAPAGEISKQFGEKFAASLGNTPVGEWNGPLESSYGVHLVFVEQRTEGRVPALAEVRDAVKREWANARRVESNEKFFEGLLRRYVVTVERPVLAEAGKEVARVQ